MRKRAGGDRKMQWGRGGEWKNWGFEDLIVKIWKGKGPAAYGMPSGL